MDTNPVSECGESVNITTATNTVCCSQPGRLLGVWVSAASATPTLKVWDSLSAAGTVLAGTFTPVAGTFYPIPCKFYTGLTVTTAGTIDCTPVWVR